MKIQRSRLSVKRLRSTSASLSGTAAASLPSQFIITWSEQFRKYNKSDIPLADINNEVVMSYIRHLQKSRTAAGVLIVMGAFKRIIHYVEENGWVRYDVSPFLGVKMPKSQP